MKLSQHSQVSNVFGPFVEPEHDSHLLLTLSKYSSSLWTPGFARGASSSSTAEERKSSGWVVWHGGT